MTINKNINGFKEDYYEMALAYKEMGDLNLTISKEMEHLEWEAVNLIEAFIENINVLEI
ncbi:hypothetical protein PVA17_10465 [Lysinibacillus sp. CNPSo 3705]|uniref:hypothetical protein n=1 Tax=Lysinibacillus sp. CNPSo 3705 TaxID=3028148 RepID=UPI0023636AC7|nr:hypothetical protein [Lysinibacillus sp. CNPSo 3705]MDD1503178.1 hypothetical protein [Lysinibacillus sp. CNPSo 3705]